MTLTARSPAVAPVRGGGPAHRGLIAVLAVTQTVGYGVMFYSFSVLLIPISADLHASTAAVTGAFTTAIVFAAGASIPVGRWLDRRGGRALMAAGSILAVATVVLWSRVDSLWQLLILAGILALITVPGHLLAVPSRASHHRAASTRTGIPVREALQDKSFWLLTVAFVVHGAALSAMGVLLIVYLQQAGHSMTIAATLAGLLGVLSVTGRLVTTGLAKHHSVLTVTAVVFAVQAAGAGALPFLGGTLAGAAACVIAFGLGFGVATIARPAILAGRYGTARYATIASAMTVPITLAKAAAPLGAALLVPTVFMLSVALACLLAAVLLAAAARLGPPRVDQ
jgi:hypothetical protein